MSNVIPPPPPTLVVNEEEAPIVLDLGKRTRKQIRRLRKGNGKLMDRIESAIQDLKADGTVAGSARPIIVVVRQKSKRSIFGL